MDSDQVLPSSSPGFGTPAHPLRKSKQCPFPTRTSILPILLPPSTLRPVAFRTITRKHNLTISSSALQALATFVGRNCGSGWREEGLAERVLDEVAKGWRKAGGSVIVEDGKGASLKAILQAIEGNMSGGRVSARVIDPEKTHIGLSGISGDVMGSDTHSPPAVHPPAEFEDGESALSNHPRHWVKVIEAFDTPRLTYNANKKYFEITKSKPTLFPAPSQKTALFRDRYNIVYQRLLRTESFQMSSSGHSVTRSSSNLTPNHCYKLTPIANLLGRSGTSHLLLGLLSISPTGNPAITDLTGSIALELSHARTIPDDGAWFGPGMIVLIDGIYEEEENVRGTTLGGNNGIGGTLGGRFVGVSICGPPCERRESSLGTNISQMTGEVSYSGGLGWIDFLGVGSERARGLRMRQIQAKCLQDKPRDPGNHARLKMAIMSEVHLNDTRTLEALRKLFGLYNHLSLDERPIIFILIGNFVDKAVINGGGQAGSIEYKEHFDALAIILSEFPSLLQHSTFVFVPGDHDPWASAFSAGAASPIPRRGIPELFTSRVKRAFSTANSEFDRSKIPGPVGEAIWTSNPSRLSIFGPVHDIAIFRDDISARLRRSAVNLGQDDDIPDTFMHETPSSAANKAECFTTEDHTERPPVPTESKSVSSISMARKLVKTVLDQGTMSPFPLSSRPILWDYASSLQLFPLPTSFVLADAEAVPFCMTYEGCHVMNPGRLIPEGGISMRWIEYDILRNRGKVREERLR